MLVSQRPALLKTITENESFSCNHNESTLTNSSKPNNNFGNKNSNSIY